MNWCFHWNTFRIEFLQMFSDNNDFVRTVAVRNSASREVALTNSWYIQPAIDVILNVYTNVKDWYEGNISGERCAKNVINDIATAGGVFGGGAAGAAIGGLGGPIGAFFGESPVAWLVVWQPMPSSRSWRTRSLIFLNQKRWRMPTCSWVSIIVVPTKRWISATANWLSSIIQIKGEMRKCFKNSQSTSLLSKPIENREEYGYCVEHITINLICVWYDKNE